MALDLAALKAHCNVTFSTDDTLLTSKLAAAKAFVERQLGYALTDTTELPDGAPDDLEEAVLQVAAHLYENREATLVGVTAQRLPFGVDEIIAGYRTYSFAVADE
jgi:uncharacterized phage protein (predicted DNA packaging)